MINQAIKITVDTTITAARVELKRLAFLGLGLLTITMVAKILAEAKLSLDNAASFEDPRMKSIEVGGRQAINYRHKTNSTRRLLLAAGWKTISGRFHILLLALPTLAQ